MAAKKEIENQEEKLVLSKEEFDAKVLAAVDAALKKKAEEESGKAKAAAEKAAELVPVHLIYTKELTEPVFVGVNGKTFLIKRGEDVMVPRYVKEVLDNSEKQDRSAYDLITEKEKALAGMG